MYCFDISKKPQNTLSTFLQEPDNTVSEDGLTDHDDGIYTLPGWELPPQHFGIKMFLKLHTQTFMALEPSEIASSSGDEAQRARCGSFSLLSAVQICHSGLSMTTNCSSIFSLFGGLLYCLHLKHINSQWEMMQILL